MSTHSAEDIVQSAFLALAVGARQKSKGRHPRQLDVAGTGRFVKYLEGIIRSLISCERHRLERHFFHDPWDENLHANVLHVGIRSGSSVASEVAFHDLSECFFRHLARRIPDRLQGLLGAWHEQKFDCDKIPLLGGHRRLRIQLRTLAAEVMRELN